MGDVVEITDVMTRDKIRRSLAKIAEMNEELSLAGFVFVGLVRDKDKNHVMGLATDMDIDVTELLNLLDTHRQVVEAIYEPNGSVGEGTDEVRGETL